MGAPNWMFETDLPDDIISNSLRFEDGSTHYLSKTPASAGNRRTFTISLWFKRGNLGSFQELVSAYDDSSEDNSSWFGIALNSTDIIRVDGWDAQWLQTSQVVRDTTNWYHLVVAVNSTDSTADDRIKVYLNGSQITSFGTRNNPSEDHDFGWNNTIEQRIGAVKYSTNAYPFDGYIADVNCIDGSALTPTSFGREVNGVWIPKDTSGLTFGTNGFRLQFKQTGTGTASASTIGADTSGNTNHFTSNNLASTDVVTDTPDNNFATFNPLLFNGNSYSEGNLKNASGGNDWEIQVATMFPSNISGKWYAEFYVHTCNGGGTRVGVGVTDANVDPEDYLGNESPDVAYYDIDDIYTGGSATADSSLTYAAGDTISVLLNLDDGEVTFKKNNITMTNGTQSLVADTLYTFATSNYGSGAGVVANFGQDDTFAGALSSNSVTGGGGKFRYAPPAGYNALCSRNLNEPIFSANPNRPENANDNFTTHLYTANNQTAQTITGVGMQPDFLWFKQRSRVDSNALYNTSMGIDISMRTTTDPEFDDSNSVTGVTAVGADGFTLGTDAQAWVNYGTDTMVSWLWKANGGTTTTNDASVTGVGTIDSTYQANTDAGFSIVTYTGTGSAGTLAHGLGAVPQMIIVKLRNTSGGSWIVYHHEMGASPEDLRMFFDSTEASGTSTDNFNSTAPTSTVFSVGGISATNGSSNTYVAYLFSEVEGYSKFAKYTGNGNADGPYVHLGFRPKMFVVKRADSTGWWAVSDSTRSTFNEIANTLAWSGSYSESTLTSDLKLDFLSNGVKIRDTDGYHNASGGTYVYMAFAESPFKYSNAA